MQYRRMVVVVALVGLGLAGGMALGPGLPADEQPPAASKLVQPDGTESYVWPYTSRSRSVEGRTLALNVVVHGHPERVERALRNRSGVNWTSVEDDTTIGTSPWQPARGAARYTYVATDKNGDGRWVKARYHLGTGSYLGHRVHVRAYPGPASNWTALQAHTEYWDWFRLRHTVTGVSRGARFVERDLRDEPFVDRISRVYHGLGGGGSDGWLTAIELSGAAVLVGVAVPMGRRRVDGAEILLPVGLALLVLGVRAAGIAAEAAAPGLSPKLFAALLYPVLAAGPPILAARVARGRGRTGSPRSPLRGSVPESCST
ncbi:hypothetical protein VB773_09275 [Haloarculaceae archaeon H-GB2-1]|nr:hypothetical protein [Haloarculaceae archaeon H-GB11]MEA5407738.1 hypothetical protein [Haloarculaceae archaeon H-GB2-1]